MIYWTSNLLERHAAERVSPLNGEIPMEKTNHLVTTPTTTECSSSHGGARGSGGRLSRWRGLVFGGGAVVAALALALNQHWLTVADLPPLLFLLPCALMMLHCMKGMNHGQQASGAQASTNTDKPTGMGAALG
jgi:hypothetical protein